MSELQIGERAMVIQTNHSHYGRIGIIKGFYRDHTKLEFDGGRLSHYCWYPSRHIQMCLPDEDPIDKGYKL